MDPTISRVIGPGLGGPGDAGQTTGPKTEPSKFDKIRENLEVQSQAKAESLLPAETGAPKPVAQTDRAALRAQLDQSTAAPPVDLFTREADKNRLQLDQMVARVQSLPESGSVAGVKQRLAGLEQQLSSVNDKLSSLNSSTSPADILALQSQLYQISEQVEMVSKVVEQVSGGVKQIMQTQV